MSNNIGNMPFSTELLAEKQRNEKRLWKAVIVLLLPCLQMDWIKSLHEKYKK